MKTREVIVPAPMIQVGHVVNNTFDDGDLEVLSVDARCEFGNNYYTVVVGSNGKAIYSVNLNEKHTLTFTYAVKE